MTTPLKDALIDVRRAYRLLADYQKRLLETLEFMRNELGFLRYHHEYNSGNTTIPSPYRLTENPLGGMLSVPLLWTTLFWLKQPIRTENPNNYPQQGDMMISVWLRNDTRGHPESYWSDQDADWIECEDTLPPEDGESDLVFAFYICDRTVSELTNWYGAVYGECGWPVIGQVIETESPEGFRIYLDKIDQSTLDSEEGVLCELNALRQRASEKLGVQI